MEYLDDGLILKSISSKPSLQRVDEKFEIVWTFEIVEKTGQYLVTDGEELIFFQEGESSFINKSSGELSKKERRYYYHYKNETIAYTEMNSTDCITILYKGIRNEVPHLNSHKYFFENNFVEKQYHETILSCHSMESGKEKWKLDLREHLGSKNTKQTGEIINYEGKLIFFLSDGTDNITTVSITLEDGNIVQENRGFGGWLVRFNNMIYVVNSYEAGIMNADSFEIEKIDLTSELSPHNVGMEWNVFIPNGSYLYFTNFKSTGLGILDLKEKKLVCYHEIEVENKSIQKIMSLHLHKGVLFAQTSDNSVHVFQILQESSP